MKLKDVARKHKYFRRKTWNNWASGYLYFFYDVDGELRNDGGNRITLSKYDLNKTDWVKATPHSALIEDYKSGEGV